jgi:hypothetical protein
MKFRLASIIALLTLTTLLAGCGSGNVQAVAPAHQERLIGTAPESGQYSLYRATGLDQNAEPTLEKIWSVSASRGQRLGFQWVVDKAHQWDPQGGFHLIAFAGRESRDLGGFIERDVKYAWAGNSDDVMGYFHGKAVAHDFSFDE